MWGKNRHVPGQRAESDNEPRLWNIPILHLTVLIDPHDRHTHTHTLAHYSPAALPAVTLIT